MMQYDSVSAERKLLSNHKFLLSFYNTYYILLCMTNMISGVRKTITKSPSIILCRSMSL